LSRRSGKQQEDDHMKTLHRPLAIAAGLVLAAPACPAPTIAITEFLSDPLLNQDTDEFIELYNYGPDPVELVGWTISDDNSSDTPFGDLTLASGGYLILSREPAAFATNWGDVGAPVIDVHIGNLGNNEDQIILRDAVGNVAWTLGYPDDEVDGRATWLAIDNFATTDYGDLLNPRIVRAGPDLVPTPVEVLGYEDNFTTPDPQARVSAVTGDTASPGAGAYTTCTDADGDGALCADNCLGDANADQRDTNGDGFGNLCDGDFDGTCAVNFGDLATMKSQFFQGGTDTDMTGDDQTNFADLGLLKGDFFLPPGPSGLPNACASP
jgi:hypothetical protein